MKYQLLNGWTPHDVFKAWIVGVNTEQIPAAFFRSRKGNFCLKQPFSLKIFNRIVRHCELSKNTHEAFARWLVANTEGDW